MLKINEWDKIILGDSTGITTYTCISDTTLERINSKGKAAFEKNNYLFLKSSTIRRISELGLYKELGRMYTLTEPKTIVDFIPCTNYFKKVTTKILNTFFKLKRKWCTFTRPKRIYIQNLRK